MRSQHWSEEIEKENTDVDGQRDRQGWRVLNRGMQFYRRFKLGQSASGDV